MDGMINGWAVQRSSDVSLSYVSRDDLRVHRPKTVISMDKYIPPSWTMMALISDTQFLGVIHGLP